MKTLPDVAPPSLDLFRVCYQHNGQPLDHPINKEEVILPGIQGKFQTRQEAEVARKKCRDWFNIIKWATGVPPQETIHTVTRDVVDVWIEHYVDGELKSSDRPKSAVVAAPPVLETSAGMTFATMLHEMLCEDYANTPDEAAGIMDRHTDYIASCVSGGMSLAKLRACAVALEEKESSCRDEKKEEGQKEEPKPKAAKKEKPREVKSEPMLPDPRGAEVFPELSQVGQ